MTETPITDGEVKRVFDKMLERNPDECPLCSGKIDITTHEMYDKGCLQCGTKFVMREVDEELDIDRASVPSMVMETTPVKRMKKIIWQKANERAALETFNDDDE